MAFSPHFTLITISFNNIQNNLQGDSGSPLVINGEIVGIASSYLHCGSSPSLFTKVYAFKTFIQEETNKNC